MCNKRFIIDNNIRLAEDKIGTYELSTLVDNDYKTFYFIVDNVENVEILINRLNQLNDNNETLKDIILFANALMKKDITQHDYWKFRTVCKNNGVDLE